MFLHKICHRRIRNITAKSSEVKKLSSPLLGVSSLGERATAATVHLLYRVGLDFGQNRSDIRNLVQDQMKSRDD